MKSVTLLVLLMMASTALAGTRVFPLSGGTRSEPNPKDKKHLMLIAEKPEYKLTLSTNDTAGKVFTGLLGIHVKIENLADKPLDIATSKFNAVDDTGRGYAGLEFKEAAKRYFNETAAKRHAIGIAVMGPRSGPAMTALPTK